MYKPKRFTLILFLFIIIGFIDCNAQWVKSNLPTENVYSNSSSGIIKFVVSRDYLFVSKKGYNLFISSDNGFTWNPLNSQPFNALAVSGIDLIGGLNTVNLSTDFGNSWSILDSTNLIFGISSLAVSGNNIFVGTYFNGIWSSTDNGASFIQDSNGIKNHNVVNSIVINGANVFAGTDNGILKSTDNGSNWILFNNGLTNKYVHILTASFNNILAGTDSGVFLSSNNGANWLPVINGLTDDTVYSFANVANYVFAGTNKGGVFVTTNYGANWTQVADSLSNSGITALVLSGNNIIAGSGDGSIWYRTVANIITTDVKEIQNNIPDNHSLFQNYPNPFNPTTIISYQIQNDRFVTLKVYDMFGREVKTLVNGFKSQGKYSVDFDAGNFSSGVYFYQLKAGDYTAIKKMILLK